MTHKLVIPLLLIGMTALLYGGFLSNPIVFDDLYFFLSGEPEKLISQGFQFHPRWWAYFTMGLTFVHIGPELIWQRLGNLVLHVSTAISLYLLVRRLLNDLDTGAKAGLSMNWAAFLASLLFALHPVAVYAAGYLIQRTIVAATLFSLLSWLAFWLGLKGARRWLWASLPLYFLAAFSKEHAVMAPAVCAALWVLHRRSGLAVSTDFKEVMVILAFQGLIAILVTLLAINGAHEILAPEMMRDMAERGFRIPEGMEHPLSFLTQSGLFFKYLGLWILPNIAWMSVDMREPFALSFTAPRLLALVLFCLYPVFAVRLLLRGRVVGMVGFALLAPWMLFATELISVRLQEIFVLYRSYLWAPPLFIVIAAGLRRLSMRLAIGLGAILVVFFIAFSFDRLTSFSHPYLLWDEAATLAEKNMNQPGVAGLARIYHNRGLAQYREGLVNRAIEDYDRALARKPDYVYVYNDRGAARLDIKDYRGALTDFDTAIFLKRNYLRPYAGRALALDGLGRTKDAKEAFTVACKLGWKPACDRE